MTDVSVETPEKDPRHARIEELACLDLLDYAQARKAAAKDLDIPASTLDKLVAALRVDEAESDEVVEQLEPWPEPVDGAELLVVIARRLTTHTVMQPGCPTAAAVWCLSTFCMDGFRVFPKIQIKSPEKRCGKSTLMECIEGVVHRPLLTTNITASSLFRCIEAWTPTLLIDEADTFAKDNDELNGIINAGHTRRTASVIRTVKDGDDHMPKKFSVWGAQVIAGIKNQRDTLEDRSITIEMRRKLPDESVTKIPVDYFDLTHDIRRRCLRWAEDNITTIKQSGITPPPCGNDRAQDNWEPLFTVASVAGGDWLQRVGRAYLSIESRDDDDTDSAAVMLLHDLQQIFLAAAVVRMHCDDIVLRLIAMEDRPWPEWRHGNPLTKNSLSRLLKPFRIKSRQMKIGHTNRYGYELDQFADAFKRYITPDTHVQNATTLQPSTGAGFSQNENATTPDPVAFQNSRKPSTGAGCSEVAFCQGGTDDAYPPGFLDAAEVACNGLPVTLSQLVADLEPDDYQIFIDHPETARSIVESLVQEATA